jgi:hypothetical protein
VKVGPEPTVLKLLVMLHYNIKKKNKYRHIAECAKKNGTGVVYGWVNGCP